MTEEQEDSANVKGIPGELVEAWREELGRYRRWDREMQNAVSGALSWLCALIPIQVVLAVVIVTKFATYGDPYLVVARWFSIGAVGFSIFALVMVTEWLSG